MDSLKVSGASLFNYGLAFTSINTALQCVVALLTIIYLIFKINKLRKL